MNAKLSRGPIPLWVRLLSRVPWNVLYAVFGMLAAFLHHVIRFRRDVVRSNLNGALTSLDARELDKVESQYYRGLGELVAEVIKASTMTADELRSRVVLRNVDLPRGELKAGRSVLILGAHQCNWEWMLLAMSLDLGFPLAAAYKPLRGSHGERLMHSIRSRFGGRLVPAKELLTDIMSKRGEVRAIAMIADQEPVTAELKWWTEFLGRQTAFFMGPEKISRAAKFAVMYAGMRRTSRGHYEVTFAPISEAREQYDSGAVTERYARLVEADVLANPGDWMWSHRRWRLRKDAQSPEVGVPYVSR
jgi:Kdo2-lipid IVA lauroyltransferase/acyltransferase